MAIEIVDFHGFSIDFPTEFTDFGTNLPSGYVKIAIEHDH